MAAVNWNNLDTCVGNPDARVALVAMPGASEHFPSMQLGVLKAFLADHGIAASVYELNLAFYKIIGHKLYQKLASNRYLADHVFSSFINDAATDKDDYDIDDPTFDLAVLEGSKEEVALLARCAAEFLDDVAASINWGQFTVIGFTLTHMQSGASLALANRIKRTHPDVCIVLGGIQCFGDLGESLLEHFHFVDVIVDGAGEEALLSIVRQRLSGNSLSGISECRVRSGQTTEYKPRESPKVQLDELPIPDFTDHFKQAAYHGLLIPDTRLPVEGARGCWWNKCTFCAINIQYPRYHRKSAARLVAEIDTLVKRHQVLSIHLTDSIQPNSGIDELVERIKRTGRQITLTMEMYATVTREQLAALWSAGLRFVQVGVESLAAAGLTKMKKGTTVLQNIQVMKWCHELGIVNWYNLIAGYPRESPDEILEMYRLIPRIIHLPPPGAISEYKLNYASPDYEQTKHLLDTHRAAHFRLPDSIRHRLNVFETSAQTRIEPYWTPLIDAISTWRDRWSSSEALLSYRDGGDFLIVDDLRDLNRRKSYVLRGAHREVLLLCRCVQRFQKICQHFDDPFSDDVKCVLEDLVDRGLMLAQSDCYLSLPLSAERFVPALDN